MSSRRAGFNGRARMGDFERIATRLGRDAEDWSGMVGYGTAVLFDERGRVKELVEFVNKITDVGDEYYAKKGIAAVAPANPSAPNAASGMRLGTGVAAEAKNGSGSSIGTYVSGSSLAFDATYPSAASKGAGLGWRATYRRTWAAGVATATGISEVVITNETPLSDVIGTSANTISRALLTPLVNKGVLDTLEVTWHHDFLGA